MKYVHHVVVVIAVAFLGAVAGSYMVFVNAAPARYLTDAYRGGHALLDKWSKYEQEYPTEFWQPARSDQSGVTVYDQGRATKGVTLFTSGDGAHAVLVSMTGEVMHEWRLPFSEWDESAAVKVPQPDSLIYFRKAHLYPNGDLLVALRSRGRYTLGLRLGQDRRALQVDMEISCPRASRSRRRSATAGSTS